MAPRAKRTAPALGRPTADAAARVLGEARYSKRRTFGDPRSESFLVSGDNEDVLGWLRRDFEGAFRCVYLDPPFNTGRSFAEYHDARSPSEWREFLRARLLLVRPLLARDGAVFLEIDDRELGAAIVLGDEIFGRACRVSTVTLVRSAATGHKAKNRGPVNVTDFILIYEREPGAWRCRPERRVRQGYDRAYSLFLSNPDAPIDAWQFESLRAVVARRAGYASVSVAKRALGALPFETATVAFALAHARQVVRFAQPRFEAVSRAAQEAIVRSRQQPERVLQLVRPGLSDLILRGGNRLLFLASKVAVTPDGPRLVEPLTNVWDDVPFQGIAREGGVVFQRNKKPERLLERILALATDEGDWVLDPFLGSGTTAAVAEKMGRRWVGVESGEVLWSRAVPRLERVVQGEDRSGITGTRAATRPASLRSKVLRSPSDERVGAGFSVYA